MMYTFKPLILIKIVLFIIFYCKNRSLISPEQSKLYQTLKQGDDHRKMQQLKSKLQVSLFKQKELLKKDILKKRALLEKELQIDIQVCILNSCFSRNSVLSNFLTNIISWVSILSSDSRNVVARFYCSVQSTLGRRKEFIWWRNNMSV